MLFLGYENNHFTGLHLNYPQSKRISFGFPFNDSHPVEIEIAPKIPNIIPIKGFLTEGYFDFVLYYSCRYLQSNDESQPATDYWN